MFRPAITHAPSVLVLCACFCAWSLTAAPIIITTSTTADPAPRVLNTTGTYRIADSATLAFRNSLGASGTDGGVFAYNGSATYALLFTATGATDPATGLPAGTSAVVFDNNHADKHGGAISVANNKVTLTLANATLALNSTGSGNGGALVTNGTSRIHNALFTSNTAGASGGAFYNTGNATLTNARFDGNVAATSGGAIYNSTNSLTLTSGTFANNTAQTNGGALYNTGANTSVALTDVVILANQAAAGGAIYANSGTVAVTRALFQGNIAASGHGGAIYASTAATTVFTDVAFAANTASSNGGAIYTNRGALTIRATTSATNIGNKSSGTTGATGGFLYITGTDATVNFDITGANTRYTIGAASAADRTLDTIASGGSSGAAIGHTINKSGDGALILNADNSNYHGAINIAAGALFLGNAAARLSATTLTVNGGALGGLGVITGNVEFRATSTLFIDGGLLTFATATNTAVTLRDGATIGGSGTLALTGANNALILATGTVFASVTANHALTLATPLTGSAALEKRDAGLLTLSATANNFTGGLVLSGGTLAFDDDAQLGSPTNAITFTDNATLALAPGAAGIALSNTLALAPAAHGVLDTQTRTLAFGGALTGSGTLSKTGAGALEFLDTASAAHFFGTLRIAEGRVTLGNTSIGGSIRVEPDARLELSAPATTAPATLTIGGTLSLHNATISFTLFSGTASDGFLNSDRIHASNITASGNNTIDITRFAQSGTYNLGNIAPLADARVTVGGVEQLPDFRRQATLATSGTLLLLVAQVDMSRALTWTGGGGVAANLWTAALAGQWTDAGAINRFADGDRVIFQNTNATIEIPANVTVSDMHANTPGTLVFTGAQITADASSIITGTLSSATGRLVKSGAGTLAFENAANNFSGGITLESGTLAFTRASQLNTGAAPIAVTGNATLRFAATATTAGLANALNLSPAATATIDTAGNTLTLTGAISGSGALTKTGAGTLILATPATHKGATTITAGTLRADAPDVLSRDSHITLAAGAMLDLAGHSQTIRSLDTRGTLILGPGTPRLSIIGDYAATPGAILNLTLALSDTAAPKLGSLAIGGSASGQTRVRIQTTDTRVVTRNTAIPVASLAPLVTTAMASSGTAFIFADTDERIVIGAYDYVLQPDNFQSARAWSLVLDALSPEIPAVAGTDALALQTNRAALDALASRLAGQNGRQHTFNIWADALYHRDTVNKTIYTGASISIAGIQAGADFTQHARNHACTFGIFADYTDADMRFNTRMSTTAAAQGAGFYAALKTRTWHIAAIFRAAKADYDATIFAAPPFATGGKSAGFALQTTRAFQSKSGWRIEPLAELAWQRHTLDTATDAFGRAYETDAFTSLAARAACAFARTLALRNNNTLTPSIRLGAVNEFDACTRMTVAGTPVESDLGGLTAEIDAALTWQTAEHWNFTARITVRAGGNFDGYNLSIGAARAW